MKHIPPQRLSPAAPIGSLLKREHAERPAKGARKPTSSPSHLVAIRMLPCLKCGMDPCGEAAHVKKSHVMMGRRPPDSQVVPLCRACHQIDPDAQHRIGEEEFWGRMGINPLLVARKLWEASGDVVKMRAIVFTFIAMRET